MATVKDLVALFEQKAGNVREPLILCRTQRVLLDAEQPPEPELMIKKHQKIRTYSKSVNGYRERGSLFNLFNLER